MTWGHGPGCEPTAILDADVTGLFSSYLHGLADPFARDFAQMPHKQVIGPSLTARGTLVQVRGRFGGCDNSEKGTP